MQYWHLVSCRCSSWTSHTHWCITSATPPDPYKVRETVEDLRYIIKILLSEDVNYWILCKYLHIWTKQGRDYSLISRQSMHPVVIEIDCFCSHAIERLYPNWYPSWWGPVPLTYYPSDNWISSGKMLVCKGQNYMREKSVGSLMIAGHSQDTDLFCWHRWIQIYTKVVSWQLDGK